MKKEKVKEILESLVKDGCYSEVYDDSEVREACREAYNLISEIEKTLEDATHKAYAEGYESGKCDFTSKKKNYTTVRSYQRGPENKELNELLSKGWIIERASDYVPEFVVNGYHYYGYIEYVLSKEED